MFMDKRVGYVVAVVGLVLMALGFGTFKIDTGFLGALPELWIVGGGVVLIVVGVAISLMDKGGGGKIKHAKEEVPIYEGIGKNRKIVGYRKD